MGLTTSCEAIERQANPTPNEPDPVEPDTSHVGKTFEKYFHHAAGRASSGDIKHTPEDIARQRKKKKPKGRDKQQVAKRPGNKASPSGKPLSRTPSGKSTVRPRKSPITPRPQSAAKPLVKKGTPKKHVPPKSAQKPLPEHADISTPKHTTEDNAEEALPPPRPPPLNAHRAKIAVGKQALAAIKEGTRIYIKSGEGNGGDTWWDSGVILKIHERGKRFEVEWQGINNRGEEVDTNVEKRIDLPVTYSLAGAAADAIAAASTGTESASFARKGVLAEARIGSWCIQHPEEPWGMLDPFGEDSSIMT